MVKYGITDLATVIGGTTNAIRYYEKEHVLLAPKGSGRREYDDGDVFRLLSYMKYHSMEIPVKEIADQFTGAEDDRRTILKRERQARDSALHKAEYYSRLADSIEMHIREIERIDSLLGNYSLEMMPDMYFMQAGESGWIPAGRDLQKKVTPWINHMPQVQIGIADGLDRPFGYLVRQDSSALEELTEPELTEDSTEVMKDPLGQIRYGYETDTGANVVKHDISGSGSELNDDKYRRNDGMTVISWPACLCVHTIIRTTEAFVNAPEKIFTGVREYAAHRHFRLPKDCNAWGKVLLVEVSEGVRLHAYVDVWMPIE